MTPAAMAKQEPEITIIDENDVSPLYSNPK